MDGSTEKQVVRTVCTMMDVFACALSVEVRNGVITRVSPAAMPSQDDQGACRKGLAAMELVYHKDRLRYPLKRTGKRGQGKWQRVSWDEALDDIADRIRDIGKRYDTRSIAWAAKGFPESLKVSGYLRLASLLKASKVSMIGLGDAAAPCADIATFGCIFGDAHLSRMEAPQFTIVWGQNPDVTDCRRMRRIMKSRKKGCKVVVIDPRFTSTASRAGDQHIPIRPGTDTALALGMIHLVMEQGLQDERFIIEHTNGPLLVRDDNGFFLREREILEDGSTDRFMVLDGDTASVRPCDAPGVRPALTDDCSPHGIPCRPAYRSLMDAVREYTPERVSGITDIPADVIRRLATEYGTQRPASIHRGWGLQRTFHGDLTCRALNTLAAVTGNLNLHVPVPFIEMKSGFTEPGGPFTNIPVMDLYSRITSQEPFPIKALWFTANNFVNQASNQNRILEKLFPQLDLIVVSDLFMTATAQYADYVLPVSSSFEYTDFHYGVLSRTNYMHLQQKVIEPLHESRPDFRIAADLGRKLGFGAHFHKTEEQYLEEILSALSTGHPLLEGITLEKLKAGPLPEPLPEKPAKPRTPTGRVEFYVERLKPFGQELPVYLEPVESVRTEKAKKYPLSLLTSHPRYRVHSMMGNCPSLLKKDPEPILQIHPQDAEVRNVRQGDVVRVFNDLGQVKVKAALSENIKQGVVNIDEGWWPEQYIEGHGNALTHEKTNVAQTAVFEPNVAYCDVLVEVEKG